MNYSQRACRALNVPNTNEKREIEINARALLARAVVVAVFGKGQKTKIK